MTTAACAVSMDDALNRAARAASALRSKVRILERRRRAEAQAFLAGVQAERALQSGDRQAALKFFRAGTEYFQAALKLLVVEPVEVHVDLGALAARLREPSVARSLVRMLLGFSR